MSSCSESYVPKPIGYYLIELPTHSYLSLPAKYPFTFEYSQGARIVDDTSKYSEPNWISIQYPAFDAEVELTYKPLTGNAEQLQKLIADSRKLVNKHQIKASAIEERVAFTQSGGKAFLFELQGQVPSQLQFYSTDSAKHFLRGALYFKTASKNDSLAPVIKYIATDIHHLIETLAWKK